MMLTQLMLMRFENLGFLDQTVMLQPVSITRKLLSKYRVLDFGVFNGGVLFFFSCAVSTCYSYTKQHQSILYAYEHLLSDSQKNSGTRDAHEMQMLRKSKISMSILMKPNEIHQVLRELVDEVAKQLAITFKQSCQSFEVPAGWKRKK